MNAEERRAEHVFYLEYVQALWVQTGGILCTPAFADLCARLLREWCHRTGTRYQGAALPLYRLRAALSRLWLAAPPPGLHQLGLNSE